EWRSQVRFSFPSLVEMAEEATATSGWLFRCRAAIATLPRIEPLLPWDGRRNRPSHGNGQQNLPGGMGSINRDAGTSRLSQATSSVVRIYLIAERPDITQLLL